AGVVDQYVEFAERVHKCVDGIGVGHLTLPALQGAQIHLGIIRSRSAGTGHRASGAGLGEITGDGIADAAGTAGHQHVGVGEVEADDVHSIALNSLMDLVSQAFSQKLSLPASSASCASAATAHPAVCEGSVARTRSVRCNACTGLPAAT